MYQIIIKATGFIVMILLGIFSRKAGLVTKAEGKTFGKVIMNFTLPCSLIYGFASVQFNILMILSFFIGLGLSIGGMVIGKKVYGHKSNLETANGMLCCSCYNISNFAIPFCQSFFTATATGYLGMFDVGNCIMCLGGVNAFVEMVLHGKRKVNIKTLVSNLLHSVPFVVYLFLIFMSIIHINFPQAVMDVVGMIAPANIFLIMFMAGTQVDLTGSISALLPACKIIGIRYMLAIAAAIIIYFLPLPLLFRQVMMIVPFSPISSPTLIYAQQNGCDVELTAMVSTLSMLCSIATYVVLIIVLL